MSSSEEEAQPQEKDARIRLCVGHRIFTTTAQTLTAESSYFGALLSNRWETRLEDGSYFIDSDPDLFEHILRYLRHLTFPLFFDPIRGHDLGLYVALMGEANYFGITRLYEWLKGERYFDAVYIQHTAELNPDCGFERVECRSDTMVELRSIRSTRSVYVCPRDIEVHRGKPQECGRRCENAQGGVKEYEEEPCLDVIIVKKEIRVRSEVCLP